MKTIAFIDLGRRVPKSAWGSSFLRHGTVKEAFAAKDAFQKATASDGRFATSCLAKLSSHARLSLLMGSR